MCGTAMPQVNSEANTPPGTPAWCSSSQTITASAPSPPPPPTSSGKLEPSRPASPAARCSSRGSSPLRSHSSTCGRISRSANARTVLRSASRSGVVQMLTTTLLECRHGGCAATRRAPWPAGRTGPDRRRPGRGCSSMTKFTARRLGSRCRVTGRSAVSGSSSRSSSTVNVWASQRHCSSVRTHTPTLRRPALVAAAGAGDAAERHPPRRPVRQRLWQRRHGGRLPARESRSAQAISTRVPSACTAMCGDLGGVDVAGGVHAVDLTVARRRGDGEARVAGQRQFDCGRGELASHVGRVGIADHAAQQRAGRFLGVGVGVVGAGQRPLQLGGLDRQRGLQLPPHQIRLGLDVQAGQHERHRVAESADAVQRHLAASAAAARRVTPLIRTRSAPSADSSMVSIRAVTSGLA